MKRFERKLSAKYSRKIISETINGQIKKQNRKHTLYFTINSSSWIILHQSYLKYTLWISAYLQMC